MSIFTTPMQGHYYPPGHEAHRIERDVLNAQRVRDWRERLERQKTKEPLWKEALATVGLLMILATALTVAWAIGQVPEPETRTFERPVSNDTYTRTQQVWRIEE